VVATRRYGDHVLQLENSLMDPNADHRPIAKLPKVVFTPAANPLLDDSGRNLYPRSPSETRDIEPAHVGSTS
jgi:hypothetical protein